MVPRLPWWRRLVPRYRSLVTDQGRVSSFRWIFFGYDSLRSKKGYFYVQWGRKLPLKFFIKLPSVIPTLPTFLLSSKWDLVFSRRTFVAGRTKNPLNFSVFFGGGESVQFQNQNKGRLERGALQEG